MYWKKRRGNQPDRRNIKQKGERKISARLFLLNDRRCKASSIFSILRVDHFAGLRIENDRSIIRLILQPAVRVERPVSFRQGAVLLIFDPHDPRRQQKLFLRVLRIILHISKRCTIDRPNVARVNQLFHFILDAFKRKQGNVFPYNVGFLIKDTLE